MTWKEAEKLQVDSELSNFQNLCVTRHHLTPHPDIKYVGTPGLNNALRLYLSNLLSSEIKTIPYRVFLWTGFLTSKFSV